ncbi:hypothetical protein SynBIOSE41_02319 [Synechococcus sp. BIOS-E4-1]|nr:hypothetical protein SynBIOSE41_02319 [Synechococcus sp. BIOS-E4-1]
MFANGIRSSLSELSAAELEAVAGCKNHMDIVLSSVHANVLMLWLTTTVQNQ